MKNSADKQLRQELIEASSPLISKIEGLISKLTDQTDLVKAEQYQGLSSVLEAIALTCTENKLKISESEKKIIINIIIIITIIIIINIVIIVIITIVITINIIIIIIF